MEGIFKLAFKNVDAFVTDIPSASFYSDSKTIQNLKVLSDVGYTYHFSIASRIDLPILHSVLQKALNSISAEQKTRIFNKWINIDYRKFYETWQFWAICISSVLIIMVLLWIIKTWTKRAKELKIAKELADIANKSKSEFLANMSHEIRTPMNAILGFADLMLEDETNEQKKTFLKYISTSGHILLKLINDILDLAKIESGKLTISPTSCKISNVFFEIVELFQIKATAKGISIKLNIDKQLPDYILIDEVRLRQILLNIVGNAIKFTNKGKVQIEVSSQQKSTGYILLTINVIDTGIGISENEIEKIFTAFEQVKNQNYSLYGGTGLGLTITKRLVEMMDGKISVFSKLNEGSTFEIFFPNISLSQPNVAATELPLEIFQDFFHELSILIVEDNEINRAYIIEIFKPFSTKLTIACNGEEALQKLAKFTPDMILSDIKMPVLDGFGLIKEIQKSESLKKIPIIAVSASVMKEQEQSVLDAGFKAFIRKPVIKNELFNTMVKFIK